MYTSTSWNFLKLLYILFGPLNVNMKITQWYVLCIPVASIYKICKTQLIVS